MVHFKLAKIHRCRLFQIMALQITVYLVDQIKPDRTRLTYFAIGNKLN